MQYLSMMPALESHRTLRDSRVDSWRTLATPDWNATLLGDAHRHESERYGPAELTDLGAKLLGLKPWHADADAGSGDQNSDRNEATGDGACAASA